MQARSALTSIVLAALAGAVGGCAGYQADLEAHEERVAAEHRIADTAMGPIQYAEAGSGPPVLVIHGSGGGFDQGMLLAGALVDGDHRVVAPSRFGYLGTPLPADAGPRAQAEAYVALLDSLGIEQTAVLSFSAGAPSALALAKRWPERVSAVALLVPALGPTESPFGRLVMYMPFLFDMVRGVGDYGYWAANRVSRPLVFRLVGVYPEVAAAAPREEREFATRMLDEVHPIERRIDGVETDVRVLRALADPDLADLEVPLLVICARDDLLVGCTPAEQIAGAAPQAQLEHFDRGGHLLLGRHSVVRAILREFFTGADS